MSRAAAQLGALLQVALSVDWRGGGPFRGRVSRAELAFAVTLFFYFCFGAMLATGAVSELPLLLRLATYFTLAGVFLAFNLLAASQQLLLAPTDIDVLYWRPIGDRTLFFARVLHLLVDACVLSAALLAAPLVAVVVTVPERRLVVGLAFGAAALLNTVAAVSIVVVAYTTLLRTVARERFHDAVVWLQVVMSLLVVVVYLGLDPVLEAFDLRAAALPPWAQLLPAVSFAQLPAALGGALEARWSFFCAGLGALVVWATVAGRLLSPRYAMDLVEALAADAARPVATAASSSRRRFSLSRFLLAGAGSDPMRRAGFDFLLAHLRHDRRLRLSLLPSLAIPVVYVGFGLFTSGGWDPYSSESTATTSVSLRAAMALFGAAWLFVALAVLTLRSLASSPSWRAAWIFFAAPTRRFDAFYLGVLAAAYYGLLLPALLSVLVPLLLVWRDPVHALVHLALPSGVATLGIAILLAVDPAIPFAREPVRHERSFHWLAALLVLLPVGLLARLQYHLREHPFLLLLAGVLAGLAGALGILLVRTRLQTLPLLRPFED